MTKKLKLLVLALVMVVPMILAACGGDSKDSEKDEKSADLQVELGQKDLTLPYVAWARETVSSYLLAEVLEDIGYNVDVKQVEAGPMFSSVADGSADFQASTWLPATHKDYWDKYGDKLVKVNKVLDKAPLALTVPSYMKDVNSIEDLKNNDKLGKEVDWKITGIDAGAGIMSNTEKALDEYGLDKWKLTSSSEAAMLSELKSAMKKKEPIIVPLWKPHWAFGVMDLKMLKDPKGIYGGDGDQIYVVSRKGLEKDAPAAYKVLEQYTENYDMLEEMMPKVFQDDEDPKDVARQFIDDNPELIKEWTKGVTKD